MDDVPVSSHPFMVSSSAFHDSFSSLYCSPFSLFEELPGILTTWRDPGGKCVLSVRKDRKRWILKRET